ncbi:50S ribosomal protein L10 [Candidatus Pacearchaeota archaeon]|nr:50S ribosomal protein L10 [Candidatus Pacearchaeota archaeon]
MTRKKSSAVPKKNLKTVSELVELIKTKRTVMVASIKNIPASQYQEIMKNLRGKAVVKFPKKNLIFKAIDSSGEEAVKKLKEQIGESSAILFSDIEAFELSLELMDRKTPAKAKPGQEAPEDIEIPAGPTDFVPGPAISELGALGIQIQIEKGKIHIKESKIVAKKGEKITKAAADIMSKMGIKPFSIGFVPIAAFDTKEKKLYSDIKVDRKETKDKLQLAFSRALPFAVEIGYANQKTITFLIGKAGAYGKALENLIKTEKKIEIKEDKKEKETKGIEEKKEESEKKETEENKEVKEEEEK